MVTVIFSPGTEAYRKNGKLLKLDWQRGTVGDLLNKLNIDKREVGSVLVNNVPRDIAEKLDNNCEVYLLPVICGG